MYVCENFSWEEEAQLKAKNWLTQSKASNDHPETAQRINGKDPREHDSFEKQIETVEGAWNPGVTTTFPYPSLRARILGPG